MGFNLNKREFRDGLRLRYNWPFNDLPSKCVCNQDFSVDHAMICRRGGFIIQRHNELRDLEADLLSSVCNDVEIEPVLQDISNEQLSKGSNKAADARLDIHARGFWEKQRSAFFDVRVCCPNADTYEHLEILKKSTKCTKTKRNENMPNESTTSNTELLLLSSFLLQEV